LYKTSLLKKRLKQNQKTRSNLKPKKRSPNRNLRRKKMLMIGLKLDKKAQRHLRQIRKNPL
jgi:hypothetical protein